MLQLPNRLIDLLHVIDLRVDLLLEEILFSSDGLDLMLVFRLLLFRNSIFLKQLAFSLTFILELVLKISVFVEK